MCLIYSIIFHHVSSIPPISHKKKEKLRQEKAQLVVQMTSEAVQRIFGREMDAEAQQEWSNPVKWW